MADVVVLFHRDSERKDLAFMVNDKVVRVFTLGVDNGNFVGALSHPFRKGESVEKVHQRVALYNAPVDGWRCELDGECCGYSGEHSHSCSIEEVDFSKVLELALWYTKREEVARAIFQTLRYFRQDGPLDRKERREQLQAQARIQGDGADDTEGLDMVALGAGSFSATP